MADGTAIRFVEGFQLPYDPELPQTGLLQRSQDGTPSWGKPELTLDPEKYTTIPKRLRLLKDGRLLLLVMDSFLLKFQPIPVDEFGPSTKSRSRDAR